MSIPTTEIPHFQERLEPVIGRLRLVSEYLETPGVNQFDAASEILSECAELVQSVMDDYQRANDAVYRQYGCYGKVEVLFRTVSGS